MTNIARIVTEDVEDSTRRVVLLCGLDSEHRLVDGEWMGYCVDRTGRAPFVLTAAGFEYEGYTEAHNFGKRPIIQSELFTIANQGESEGSTYRVRSVTFY